jgi:hypothetical protein
MIIGFTTTCVISTYHLNEIEKNDNHAIFDVPAYNENPKRTNPYTAVKDICVEIGCIIM